MLFRGVSKFAVQGEAGWTGLVSQAGFQLPWALCVQAKHSNNWTIAQANVFPFSFHLALYRNIKYWGREPCLAFHISWEVFHGLISWGVWKQILTLMSRVPPLYLQRLYMTVRYVLLLYGFKPPVSSLPLCNRTVMPVVIPKCLYLPKVLSGLTCLFSDP